MGLFQRFGTGRHRCCLYRVREAVRVLVERARSRAKGEGDNLSAAILKMVEVPEKKK